MRTLVTKRLVLRALRQEDTLAMHYYAKDSKVGPMAGWEPHKNTLETLNMIKLLITDNDMWAITIDDVLIGTINLSVAEGKPYDPRIRELGFALNPEFWGQGIMPEAITAVIKYAFDILKIKKLLVKHYDFNYQSESVLKHFNFKRIKDTYEEDYKKDIQLIINYEMNRKDYKRSDFYE